jgi:hypothetical protein
MNANKQYYLQLSYGSEDGSARFKAVRITYHIDANQPPVTPTFSDVGPSSPYYSFVEAFVAAGVTSGCGGGKFCPSSFVTRAQAAALISKALELYIPKGANP